MNVNIKQKLAGKSAYIALAILLAAILVFTVVAIVATVTKRDEPDVPPIDNGGENNGPSETPDPGDNGDQTTGGEPQEPEQPTDGGKDEPDEPVYTLPCEGFVQKDYSEDVLVFSQTMNDYRVHLGVDIAGNVGDPVCSFSNGVIEKIFTDHFMGKTIIVNHGNGLKSYYMNLADTIPDGIAEGTEVKAGTVIGAIGETAIAECADSPHLHFEVRLSDKKVNPKNYVTLPSSSDTDEVYEG